MNFLSWPLIQAGRIFTNRKNKNMGYIKHHAIVITSWDEKLIRKARRKAKQIFGKQVSGIVPSVINAYDSFFIGPDGSKEGRDDSHSGDANREKFIAWVKKQAYSDGSNSLSFAELFYGEDEGKAEILDHN